MSLRVRCVDFFLEAPTCLSCVAVFCLWNISPWDVLRFSCVISSFCSVACFLSLVFCSLQHNRWNSKWISFLKYTEIRISWLNAFNILFSILWQKIRHFFKLNFQRPREWRARRRIKSVQSLLDLIMIKVELNEYLFHIWKCVASAFVRLFK